MISQRHFISSFLLALAILPSHFFSRPASANNLCSSLRLLQWVEDTAEDVVIEDLFFPMPIGLDATIESCQYFPSDNGYSVEALIDWNGPLEGIYYAARMEFEIVGQSSNWQLLDTNGALENHLGPVRLGRLIGEIGQAVANRDYYFTNNCSQPVDLAIRYRSASGAWVTDGWWRFDPGESLYLASNGQRLTSTNSVWYFYAETADGSGFWGGDHRINFDDSSLPMKEMRDNNGDYNWSVRC